MFELAALGAAMCWAVTGLIGAGPARAVGPFVFSLCRQGFVVALLTIVCLSTGAFHGLTGPQVRQLMLSGLIGIFIGDSLLFLSMVRIGPRRTGALFALNAPIAALLGWAALGEELTLQAWAGVALCAAGVGVAVLGRAGRSGSHAFEAVQGPLWVGVAYGLLSALGQALGSLIARPVMAGGLVDPFAASLIRCAVALVCLVVLTALPMQAVRAQTPLTWRLGLQIAASAFLAIVVGMTLLLFALSGGKVGIVSTLSAMSPVLILPVLWATTGTSPSPTSWSGAGMAAAGMALIFLR